jgi:hypothetical protein
MESGLTFNQLICEFESRHPRHDIFNCQLSIVDLNPEHRRFGSIGNWQSKIGNVFCGS